MTSDDLFDSIHVILVEPGNSLNVGAAARAMGNLGFRRLHLVAPRGYDADSAKVSACWAEPLIDALIIHETFEDAIGDMQQVVGLSMRRGSNPDHFVTLPTWASAFPAQAGQRTALVFGPEENGLRLEHLAQCRWVVRIPSAAECPSFNLAQSVLLVLYELTKAFPSAGDAATESSPVPTDAPTWNDLFQLDRLLDDTMAESGFIRPGTPPTSPTLVKNLFRRLRLDRREMGVLLGLFGRINTALRRNKDDLPEDRL